MPPEKSSGQLKDTSACRRTLSITLKRRLLPGAARHAFGARPARRAALALWLLASMPVWAHAQALECPTIDRTAVARLDAADSQIQRMTIGNDVDLAHEISGLIAVVKDQNAAASDGAIVDTLIAAYCRALAGNPNTSAAEKWRRIHEFDRVLMQQVAANAMPPDSSIIANVPLPPAVYQSLSNQAKASGQKTTDFLAAILTNAAGK
jgi:hypothetical protein